MRTWHTIMVLLGLGCYTQVWGQVGAVIDENIHFEDVSDLNQLRQTIDKQDLSDALYNIVYHTTCVSDSQRQLILDELSTMPPIQHPFEFQTIQSVPLDNLKCIILEVKANHPTIYLQEANGLETIQIESIVNKPASQDQTLQFNSFKPYQLVFRINGESQQSSWGLLTEKDPMEMVWLPRKGPEHISGYIHKTHKSRIFNESIIGDYRLRMGQGLIYNNYFRKGLSFTHNSLPKYGGKAFAPFHSLDENLALRGFITSLNITPKIRMLPFISLRQLDASMHPNDDSSVGALQKSGRHVSDSEISNRDRLTTFVYGTSFTYDPGKSQIYLNFLGKRFFTPIGMAESLYAKYRLNGRSSLNGSLSFDFYIKTVNLYGEIAVDHTFSPAAVIGLLFAPSPKQSFALTARLIPVEFVSQNMQTFAYATNGNENGIFLGYLLKLTTELSLTLNIDSRINPWWSYRNAPYRKSDQINLMLRKTRRKKYDVYLQTQWLKRDLTQESVKAYITTVENKLQSRIHFVFHLARGIEWRSRLQVSIYNTGNERAIGWLAYQELKYKPLGSGFSLSARISRFAINNYESRIYVFESNIGGLFSLPAYSGNGYRFYFNSMFRLGNVRTGFRFEITDTGTAQVGYGLYVKTTIKKRGD